MTAEKDEAAKKHAAGRVAALHGAINLDRVCEDPEDDLEELNEEH